VFSSKASPALTPDGARQSSTRPSQARLTGRFEQVKKEFPPNVLQTTTILINIADMNTVPSNPGQTNAPPKAGHEARLIHARDWFGQSPVAFIERRGERYQLRQTRPGKLILTE